MVILSWFLVIAAMSLLMYGVFLVVKDIVNPELLWDFKVCSRCGFYIHWDDEAFVDVYDNMECLDGMLHEL